MPSARSATRVACAVLIWICSLQAEDLKKAVPETKESSTNASAVPSGMTERELYLLNEIELLKKRLSELEARLASDRSPGRSVTSEAPGTTRTGPSPAAPDAVPAGAARTGIAPQPVAVNSATPSASPMQSAAEGGAKAAHSKAEPFAFADFTWLNGNPRTKESPLDTKVFTGEFRADTSYIYDFAHPQDHTLGGTTESGRTGEVQVQQLGIGGDFHWENVRGRLMTQFGMYSTMTPRNDASPGLGQWNLSDAYRYLSEAYGGYHFNVLHGVNVDAGIFMSYIGLFSYYNVDNGAYQPSYVSSNPPWFFNGVRVQVFPTDKLKIEPWFINGWQSYGKFNSRPGIGAQVLYRPNGSVAIISNNYGVGTDTLGIPARTRYHTDDSIEVKYYDNPARRMGKAAFSLTLDAGCESGGGVSCFGNGTGGPKQSFLGFMFYNRLWFHKDLFGLTIGGGAMTNPGRYLTLLPPINGATAISGTPYFTENPGDQFKAFDASATFDYMPSQFVTFRFEFDHRGANVPYFSGPGGITPPGGNVGPPGSYVTGFSPDLRKAENRLNMAVLVKF